MAYPYSALPTPISDATTATPNTHSGHHNSIHTALNDLLTELATAPRSLTGLHSGLLAVKVWSSTQYVWSGGTAPDSSSYTNIVFVDPTGTHDPATSTGGRSVANDLWETGVPASGGAVATDAIWDTKGDLAVATAANTAAKLAVGTNGHVLTADSAETTGIKWAAAAGGGAVATDAIWDTKGDLAIATGANTAAKLPVGSNNQVLTADSAETTGVKWATAAGGGSSLLASKSYNPGSVVNNTNSGTIADLDATNLAVTFTAPTSGQVIVSLCAIVVPGTSNALSWTLRDGSTELTGVRGQVGYAEGGNPQLRVTFRMLITGLTASTSYTYKWAQIRSAGSGSPITIYGGAPGPALMEVWSA